MGNLSTLTDDDAGVRPILSGSASPKRHGKVRLTLPSSRWTRLVWIGSMWVGLRGVKKVSVTQWMSALLQAFMAFRTATNWPAVESRKT